MDKFICPVVDLDLIRSYNDLVDRKFTNAGFEEYKITKMEEQVKLKITK